MSEAQTCFAASDEHWMEFERAACAGLDTTPSFTGLMNTLNFWAVYMLPMLRPSYFVNTSLELQPLVDEFNHLYGSVLFGDANKPPTLCTKSFWICTEPEKHRVLVKNLAERLQASVLCLGTVGSDPQCTSVELAGPRTLRNVLWYLARRCYLMSVTCCDKKLGNEMALQREALFIERYEELQKKGSLLVDKLEPNVKATPVLQCCKLPEVTPTNSNPK